MSGSAFDLNKNQVIAQQLSVSVKSGKVVHAYAFIGGSAEDRAQLGKWLAGYLLCEDPEDGPCGDCLACRKIEHGNHEDLIYLRRQKDRESIVKDQVLDLIDRISFKPFGSRYVAVIEDAQLLNSASQNKLLKTLEEPVSEAVMILLSESAEALLPTVLSRCSCFYLQGAELQATEEDAALAKRFVQLIKSAAPFYRKKAVISEIIADKENARSRTLAFLDALEEELRLQLLSGADREQQDEKILINAIKQAETSRKYIKQLHSAAYTLKQLCLRV